LLGKASPESSRVFAGNSKLLAQFPDADVQLVHRTPEHRCEVTAWLGSCLCHGAPATLPLYRVVAL
jgi:hypothetical protein